MCVVLISTAVQGIWAASPFTLSLPPTLLPALPLQSEASEFVASCDRDHIVSWLLQLNHDLHFSLDVFFRATSLLDSFLSVVKVHEHTHMASSAMSTAVHLPLHTP